MLSISDWISFLSSEKHSTIGHIIGFSAFILAAFAVIMSTTNNTWLSVIVAVLIGVVMLILYSRTIGILRQRSRFAGKLLDDIMLGKEREVSRIEEAWKDFLEGKETKSSH